MAIIDIDLGLSSLRRYFVKHWPGVIIGGLVAYGVIKLYQLGNSRAIAILDPASRAIEITTNQKDIMLIAALAIPIFAFLGAWIWALLKKYVLHRRSN